MDVDGQPTRALFESKMTSTQVCKVLDLAHGLAVELDTRDVQYARRCVTSDFQLLYSHPSAKRVDCLISTPSMPFDFLLALFFFGNSKLYENSSTFKRLRSSLYTLNTVPSENRTTCFKSTSSWFGLNRSCPVTCQRCSKECVIHTK